MYSVEKINTHSGRRALVEDFKFLSRAEDYLSEIKESGDIPIFDDKGYITKLVKGEYVYEIVKK